MKWFHKTTTTECNMQQYGFTIRKKGQYAVGIFLDLQKAIDTVTINYYLKSLNLWLLSS